MRVARKRLREISSHVLTRSFSVDWKRIPRNPLNPTRKRPLQRIVMFKRSTPSERKEIEQLLKDAEPWLNRAQRRHKSRGHRYMRRGLLA